MGAQSKYLSPCESRVPLDSNYMRFFCTFVSLYGKAACEREFVTDVDYMFKKSLFTGSSIIYF